YIHHLPAPGIQKAHPRIGVVVEQPGVILSRLHSPAAQGFVAHIPATLVCLSGQHELTLDSADLFSIFVEKNADPVQGKIADMIGFQIEIEEAFKPLPIGAVFVDAANRAAEIYSSLATVLKHADLI